MSRCLRQLAFNGARRQTARPRRYLEPAIIHEWIPMDSHGFPWIIHTILKKNHWVFLDPHMWVIAGSGDIQDGRTASTAHSEHSSSAFALRLAEVYVR